MFHSQVKKETHDSEEFSYKRENVSIILGKLVLEMGTKVLVNIFIFLWDDLHETVSSKTWYTPQKNSSGMSSLFYLP